MTDTTRDLLISLASHMAYMQGQLEARHELDNPEDYYWYRESVLLRQKVTDVLADEPAVPAPPADWEVPELVAWLRETGRLLSRRPDIQCRIELRLFARAAELLQRQVMVPVSERLPGSENCDEQGRCWAGTRAFVDTRGDRDIDYPPSWELREVCAQDDAWLPAHALPLPEANNG